MKKLYNLLIPFLILILVGSCTEKPTIVESDVSKDISELYLKKSKIHPLEMSLEEFTELVQKQRNLGKSFTSLSTTSPASWESEYGTNLLLSDDGSVKVGIGFNFNFYGAEYSEIYVNSNGNLTFIFYDEYDFDMPNQGTPMIGVIGGDFDPSAGGAVYFNVLGDSPNKRFVASWEVVPEFADEGMNTFQVQLFEGSSKIQFGYNGLTTDGINWFGGSMNVGLSANSTQYVIVASGSEVPELDGTNICFTPEGTDYVVSDEPCDVDVPLMVQKSAIIAELAALMPSGEKTDKKLMKAIEKIEKSLEPEKWIDENHLDPKKGKKVFDEEEKAVKELEKIQKDKDADMGLKDAVTSIIGTLVSIDEQLALTALEEIEGICLTDKCAKEIEKVNKELGKAAEEIAKGHMDHAIDKYKKAWEHTQHAIKHNGP